MLRNKIAEIIGNDAKVTRPTIKGDVRIIGFDNSVTVEDLKLELSKIGKCKMEELKIGALTPMRNGLIMTWVQSSLAIAIRLANAKKVQVG